jgi:hypothetical protein
MISKAPAIATLILTLVLPNLAAAARPQARPQSASQSKPQGPPPSEREIRDRAEKLLANQHNDDETLELYERVERHVERSGGANPRTLGDKTYRVIPTGSGTQKILLREDGKPVDPSAYQQQLQMLKNLLQVMANPNNPKAKTAYAKREKREKERVEFVDATKDAFIPKSAGTATMNGRVCDVFDLTPNPDFHPRSIFQDALTHVAAKLWVDHETNQMVHGEARVTSDIPFVGGIVGKVYKGSFVAIDQEEMAPNVWLPTHYEYDFTGRKFLFSFEQHQTIEVTRYRRVGRPQEALPIVEAELASGKTFSELP